MNKRITLSIDPGETTSLAICDYQGNLIQAYEFKLNYCLEPCQRMISFKKEFHKLLNKIYSANKINQCLLEVPYAIGPAGIPYMYLRGRKNNAFDLVKLVSTISAIHDQLVAFGFFVITIPAVYWLSPKEKFNYKKYCTQDLIDYDQYPFIKPTRDGLIDAVLMCKRYNSNPNLQHRVNKFMQADFSNKTKMKLKI